MAIIIVYNLIYLNISKKEVKYKIDTVNHKFDIEEYFNYRNKKSFYNFIVRDKKKTYVFSFNYDFGKKSNIIKDIKYYKNKDLECIYPIYKKDVTGEVSCLYKGENVNYSYLLNRDDTKNLIKKIGKKLEKDGYSSNILANTVKKSNYKNIEVYNDNLIDNYYFTIWSYDGLYILNNKKLEYIKLLEKDKYENKLASLVNNYYVFIDTNEKKYNRLFIYDLAKDKKSKYVLKKGEELSKNIYFNGVFDGELYITDRDNKLEYTFNPKHNKLEEVGNRETDYKIYINNELKMISYEDYFAKDYYFDEVGASKIDKKKIDSLVKINNDFYYFSKNGDFYKSFKKSKNNFIKLFNSEDVSDFSIKNDSLIFIKDDTLYFYNDSYGLRKIMKSNELKYNKFNICDFWKEE